MRKGKKHFLSKNLRRKRAFCMRRYDRDSSNFIWSNDAAQNQEAEKNRKSQEVGCKIFKQELECKFKKLI